MVKILPYKKTLYDSIIKEIQGKYFQNMVNPNLVAYFPKKDELPPNFSLINLGHSTRYGINATFLPENKIYEILLSEFHNYAEISKEQYEEYKKTPGMLTDILLAHENSEAYKEYKANLSEQKGSTCIVDVS